MHQNYDAHKQNITPLIYSEQRMATLTKYQLVRVCESAVAS